MSNESPAEEWPVSWEANERERLRDNLKMTFRQKLEWLEEMTDFAHRLQRAPTRTLEEAQALHAARDRQAADSAST